MSKLKDGRYPIMLDKERHLLFSLNAIDEVQDKFGDLDSLGENLIIRGNGKRKEKIHTKNLTWILTILLNEGALDDEVLTENQVGKLIHTGNLTIAVESVFNSFAEGVSGDDEKDEETEKNLKSEQEN